MTNMRVLKRNRQLEEVKFDKITQRIRYLIEGLDDIALSMEKISQIDSFEQKLNSDKPWVLKNE